MDLQLESKTVIVTGGASGIGKAISEAFVDEGAKVMVFDRHPCEGAPGEEGAGASKGDCRHFQVELTESSAVESAIRAVLEDTGRIDVVVNNAGVNDGAGLECGPDAFRQSLELNLVQYFSVVHHALEALKSAEGNIINIGSKVAVTGQGGTSGYAAAKGGVHSLTREWAVDLAIHGIRANAVVPAETWTPLYEKFLFSREDPDASRREIEQCIPLGNRFTQPEEIARMVVFLASPRSSHTTGQIIHVDGGYTHFDRMYGRGGVE